MDWTNTSSLMILGLFVGLAICFGLGVIAGQQR